ncbi:hypothetical protein [Bradyrhizobium sp. CB3481]|uniref:hypothetical protein n=1 Tax=Bradyrhizobium sp. CB3481 TaxID=3039158 RepID=UPI0024B0765C|nr:hypothetical protein [Bradyrhizobium sp. CB3481]WFU14631.1 hypothetical protein QA643_26540 [Bradyrhizobium sp. CB3481]
MDQGHWVGEFAIWPSNKGRVQTAKHHNLGVGRHKTMCDYWKVLFASAAIVGSGVSLGHAEEELPPQKTIASSQHVKGLGCKEELKTSEKKASEKQVLSRIA